MAAAREICDRRGILLLEDAAQSRGSRSSGRHLGTFGRTGILSFSAPKIITTGQGGAVLTDDDEVAAKVERIKDFGRAVPGVDQHESIGFNFKFTDVQAVIGLAQMARLPARVERKKALYALYASHLAEIPEVSLVQTDLHEVAPWFMDVYVDDPQGLRAHLAAAGIGSRPVYPPIHSQPAFHEPGNFPESERVARTGLWLPSSVRLTDGDVARVCGCVAEFFGRTARS
jgi:perosamine synthetase